MLVGNKTDARLEREEQKKRVVKYAAGAQLSRVSGFVHTEHSVVINIIQCSLKGERQMILLMADNDGNGSVCFSDFFFLIAVELSANHCLKIMTEIDVSDYF